MIKIFPNLVELNNFAAEKFVEIARETIKKHGRFTVALAGGSTPKSLYRLLSSSKFKGKFKRSKILFFFGDERNVSPTDAESNFRMAKETLFQPLEIAGENIFRWQTELDNADITAKDYERKIKKKFDLAENEFPRFDLILLGMGADGHTASLFPFSEALRETEQITAANYLEKLNTTRLTLTFPTINNARNIIFLVAGAEKAEILHEVLEGESQPEKLPAQNINPKDGNLFWLLEENVAKLLRNYGS